MTWNPLQTMLPEDRRELLHNILVSRKIMKVTKNGADDDTVLEDSMTGKSSTRSTSMILADLVDFQSTAKLVSGEPCAICLNDYCEGEILCCWSQNSHCQHCFHRECVMA
jgi:hypothetical protein